MVHTCVPACKDTKIAGLSPSVSLTFASPKAKILTNVPLKALNPAANPGTFINMSRTTSTPDMQLSFFQLDNPVLSQIRDEILGLDINNLTPVEALNKLNDIKKILRGR